MELRTPLEPVTCVPTEEHPRGMVPGASPYFLPQFLLPHFGTAQVTSTDQASIAVKRGSAGWDVTAGGKGRSDNAAPAGATVGMAGERSVPGG